MNIQIFKNEQFGEVRVVEIDNNPWFCAIDITNALGYTNGRKAVADHCKEMGVTKRYIGVQTGVKADGTPAIQQVAYSFINERNLYALIMHSKLESAEKFQDWVYDEVLPSIRKHGAYMNDQIIEQALTSPDFLIQLATKLKEEKERNAQLENKIAKDASKVDYYDNVLTANGCYTTTQIAKELGMGAPTLNNLLHDMKIQYKQNGSWVPYHKYQSLGLTKSETIQIECKNGLKKNLMTFRWTEEGRKFIHDKIKSFNLD